MFLHIKNICHKFSTRHYSVTQQRNKHIDKKNPLKAIKYRNIILSLKVFSHWSLNWNYFGGYSRDISLSTCPILILSIHFWPVLEIQWKALSDSASHSYSILLKFFNSLVSHTEAITKFQRIMSKILSLFPIRKVLSQLVIRNVFFWNLLQQPAESIRFMLHILVDPDVIWPKISWFERKGGRCLPLSSPHFISE